MRISPSRERMKLTHYGCANFPSRRRGSEWRRGGLRATVLLAPARFSGTSREATLRRRRGIFPRRRHIQGGRAGLQPSLISILHAYPHASRGGRRSVILIGLWCFSRVSWFLPNPRGGDASSTRDPATGTASREATLRRRRSILPRRRLIQGGRAGIQPSRFPFSKRTPTHHAEAADRKS